VLEEDVSGKTAAEDRRLDRLIRRVESGKSGGIVTAKLDRFGRNLIHGALALKRISDAGGRLVAVNDGFDSAAPGSKFIFQMRTAIAEEYLDRQTLGFNRASGGAVKAGKHVGAHVPAGYSKGEDGRLSPNGDADTIREAFERRARGDSFQSIAHFLTESGVKPGGSENNGWSRSGVQTLIANRTYLGEVRGQRELDDHGRKGEQFVNRKAHEALVSPELFAAADARKGQHAKRNGKLADTGILGGLITCEACGHKLRKKSSANGPVYACARYYGESPCPAPATATLAKVDLYVQQALSHVIGNGEVEETMDAVYQRAAAEKAVRDAERLKEEIGLTQFETIKRYGREHWHEVSRKADAELQAAQAALHEIETDDDEEMVAPDSELFTGEHWTTDRQRKLARQFIAEVTLAKGRTPARERVEIRWAGRDEFDSDLRDRIDGAWYADLFRVAERA
jgi:DNA invertase Pin-like site-specific DNA recombinase